MRNSKEIQKENISTDFKKWVQRNSFELFFYNFIVMLLILLRSAGYFHPYFPITINFIVLCSIVLAVVLLHVKVKYIFFIVIIFWCLASSFRLLGIEIWAERAGLYAVEAFIVGFFLLLIR